MTPDARCRIARMLHDAGYVGAADAIADGESAKSATRYIIGDDMSTTFRPTSNAPRHLNVMRAVILLHAR